jgi:hypothetical protein
VDLQATVRLDTPFVAANGYRKVNANEKTRLKGEKCDPGLATPLAAWYAEAAPAAISDVPHPS